MWPFNAVLGGFNNEMNGLIDKVSTDQPIRDVVFEPSIFSEHHLIRPRLGCVQFFA